MNIDEAVSLLEEWRQYEGTEISEAWGALLHLWSRIEYLYNEELFVCLQKAIITEAENAKDCFELVEEEKTFTKKTRTLIMKEQI